MLDALVLCYHAVSDRLPALLSVTPQALEHQLALLRARGYVGATFLETVTAPPGEKTVAITFDDAYKSVLEVGKPILDRYEMPGTVFVPTNFPDTPERPMAWPGIDQWLGGPFEDELLPLSWNDLSGLAADGWEIGSHTRSHPHLTRIGDAALADELAGSRALLEGRLGRPCRTLAYPYGDHDERVVAAAAAAGYEAACTLPQRFPAPRPLAWPRVGIYRIDSPRRYRLKVSRPMRRLRASRLWPAARVTTSFHWRKAKG